MGVSPFGASWSTTFPRPESLGVEVRYFVSMLNVLSGIPCASALDELIKVGSRLRMARVGRGGYSESDNLDAGIWRSLLSLTGA